MNNTPASQEIIEALWRLQKIILDTLDFNQIVQCIDQERNVLKRVSLSQTPEPAKALVASTIPFPQIEFPLGVFKGVTPEESRRKIISFIYPKIKNYGR